MGANTAYETLPVVVQTFLESNPPVQTWKCSQRPELVAPHIFHERHLDARLILKKVQMLPLERFLSLALNLTLQSLVERHIELPKNGKYGVFEGQENQGLFEPSTMTAKAGNVAQVYEESTSLYSCSLASTLLFHPRASRWSGACLEWRELDFTKDISSAAWSCYGLTMRSFEVLSEREKEVIDKDNCELIERLYRRHHPLALWQVLCPGEEAKCLLSDLDRTASVGSFDAGCCQTYGYKPPPPNTVDFPTDAPMTPWGMPLSSLGVESTLSMSWMLQKENISTRANHRVLRKRDKPPRRVKKERNSSKLSPKRDKNLSLWPEVQLLDRSADPTINFFILRAWAEAVEHDTTFIVFHCGDYERIGFRHRESQTLFISSLIDIYNCSDPSYGGLQAGLYVSIVQDAINRIKRQNELDNSKSKCRKRRRGPSEGEPPRRYNTRFMVLKERAEAEERDRDYEAVKLHVPKRSLALVELRFGKYNSSAPAAFIRSGNTKKTTYSFDEYMSLVLTSKLGYGAIGVVYDARLEVLVDGCARAARVVVKLGLQKKEIKSMRYEYSIYQYLSSHEVVEGIPHIFGLYEDVESDTVALVMSYAGNCLWQLRPDKTKGYVRVPEAVEAAYIRILKNIHRAGICHGDIGEQNLMLTDDGRVTIIDFDRAEKYPSQDKKDEEVQELIALFRIKSPAPRTEPAEGISTQRDPLDDLMAELEAEDV